MSAHTWLAFALVAILFSLLPGPAVVSVVGSALRGGFRGALAANAGALVGDQIQGQEYQNFRQDQQIQRNQYQTERNRQEIERLRRSEY